MEEVELRDYLRIIVRQKRLIIFTVAIFVVVNLIVGLFFTKPNFKTSARLAFPYYDTKEREMLLERYGSYSVISQIKNELKLKYIPQAPDLEIDNNTFLRITVVDANPGDAIRICNAILSIIAREEKGKYEKNRVDFQQQIQIILDEITQVRKQILYSVDCDRPVYFQRIHQLEARLDELRSELKFWDEKLDSLIEPAIITPAIHAELIGMSKGMGIVLSGLIGLAIGIGIAFIIEYLK